MNRAEACIKALEELVACKDLNEKIALGVSSFQMDRFVNFPQWDAAREEYARRKPLAWQAARAALAMPQWSEEVPDESGPYWVRFPNDDPNKPHRSGWLMEVYSAPTDGDWRVRHWNESHWSKRKDIPLGTRWQRISEPRAEG